MEGPVSRQPRPARAGSVDVRDEAPGAGSVGVIFGAEGLAQEPLLGVDARQHDGKRQHRENNAHARSEGQPQPSESTKRPR